MKYLLIILYVFLNFAHSEEVVWERQPWLQDSSRYQFYQIDIKGDFIVVGFDWTSNFVTPEEFIWSRGVLISTNNGIDWNISWETRHGPERGPNNEFYIDSIRAVSEIKILNNDRIFVVLRGCLMIKSDDYGQTWDSIMEFTYPPNYKYNAHRKQFLAFTNDNKYGFYSWNFDINNQFVLYTSDYGVNWKRITGPLYDDFYKMENGDILGPTNERMFMLDSNTMIINYHLYVGQESLQKANRLLKTTDKGETWHFQLIPDKLKLRNIAFYDKDTMVAMGFQVIDSGTTYNTMYKSTDGGLSWRKTQELEGYNKETIAHTNMFYLDKDNIFTTNFTPIRSTDGGETWIEDDKIINDISDITIIDQTTDGDRMIFLKKSAAFEAKKTTGVKNLNLMTHFFSLYPNPAEASDNIKLNFHQNPANKVELYDLQGNLIIQKSVNYQTEIELEISHLITGTYIVKAYYGSQSLSRKFIKK